MATTLADRGEPEPPAAALGDDQADPRAFAPLYHRYVDPIYRYCRGRLGSREAAEDATALVFARALAGLGGCRGPFRPWLFAIAHNAIANEFRHRANHPARPLAAADADRLAATDHRLDPEAAALAGEARDSVAPLLARLPPDQQRIIELRLAGLTGPEIAQTLGKNPGAVRVAQHRAITRLRALLADPPTAKEPHHG